MRKLFIISCFLLLGITAGSAQSSKSCAPRPVYTRECNDKQVIKAAKKWFKKGEWRQGFTLASPHESVNIVDFYLQYQKNPEQWTKLFQYLAKTDLLALPKGKLPIEGSDLTISVEDSENGPLETRNSESHYHGIDFQYCVKGTERFGIIDHVTSVPKDKYKKDVIHYNYDKSRALFYDSTPDKFFIFFPGDWHIAKVNNDTNDQTIRVCVIKVRWED
ncbi:MAG: YhcH/YjgK/YiaL family protein [Prevotella sp.]|nr:YhcH/YjgK/YiaL family protein [Candidatus Prevotella equi]